MVTKKELKIEAEKVDGMYLRTHLGNGEGGGVKFEMDTLGDGSLMVTVEDTGKRHVYLLSTQKVVKAIVDWHISGGGKKIVVKKEK